MSAKSINPFKRSEQSLLIL